VADDAFGSTEKTLQANVTRLAKVCGWRVYHTWLSKHSAKGFPDLLLLRGGLIDNPLRGKHTRQGDGENDQGGG
jgi:hypothetical protein